ncbi:regulatory protein [Inmirania thermothiophila]|uniref:Regulatory protein RecX n=1 Tax=Inmirania thermothiophila TaxID=1750597 RepID=A0A3N1XT69_9GAMM|nr:regulatory protein RecX [Inmirania thermothiophila]ROR29846.1 regulatory protein [Inmirania thermothiophila]
MRLLARREHSRRELLDKLRARGFAPAAAEAAVARLAAEGLQSERRFAEALVRERIARGHGPRRIEAELAQRGVAGELAAEVMAAAEVDWVRLAREVARRRFRGPAGDRREWLRRARHLAGRGFTGEQVRAALGGDEGMATGDDGTGWT